MEWVGEGRKEFEFTDHPNDLLVGGEDSHITLLFEMPNCAQDACTLEEVS